MKIYQMYDKVAKRYRNELMFAENGAMAIRNNLQWIVQQAPLKDLELYEVGEQDTNGLMLEIEEIKKIEWNEYTYPETKAEALEPLKAKEIIDNLKKSE